MHIILMLISTVLFAQDNLLQGSAQINGGIPLKPLTINTDGGSATELKLLPVTVDITEVVSPQDFQSFSISDFRAALFGGKALIINDKDPSSIRNFLGVRGELLSLDKRKMFINENKSLYSLDILTGEAVGAFTVGGKVFLQLKIYGAIGGILKIKSNNLNQIEQTDREEFLNDGACLGCESELSQPHSDQSYKWGSEIEVEYKKLNLSLFHHHVYATTTSYMQKNYGLPRGQSGLSSSSHHLKKLVDQTKTGLKLSYTLSKKTSTHQMAAFLGASLVNHHQKLYGTHGKSYTDAYQLQGSGQNAGQTVYQSHKEYTSYHKDLLQKQTLVIEAGIKVELFKIKN